MLKAITLASLIFSASAFIVPISRAYAERVTMLKIGADYFPNIAYEVGFDVHPKSRVIDRIYFNEENSEPMFFTLGELQESYVTVFKKWGFHFVKLKIVEMTSLTSGTIEISILKYAAIGTRNSLFYKVSLNPETGQYEMFDLRTHRAVKNAVVRTHYRGGLPVGIRDIEAL